MGNFSFCCPAYNEGERLKTLILSSLRVKGLNDICIIDHRSTDNINDILGEMKPICKSRGVVLRWIREDRDWQKGFMMAHLRQLAINSCLTDIVFVQDSDFIFGKNYQKIVEQAVNFLSNNEKVYGISHEIPVIRGGVKFDSNGNIKNCGQCIMHIPVVRIVHKKKVKCKQNGTRGRHYIIHPRNSDMSKNKIIKHVPSSIVSIDIKEKQRMKFRKGMTDFFEAVINKPEIFGNWTYNDWLLDINQQIVNNKFYGKKKNRSVGSNRSYNIVGERFFIN